MTKCKLAALGAAFAGVVFAASAGANDPTVKNLGHGGGSPSSMSEAPAAPTRSLSGQAVMPRDARPSSVNESDPSKLREHQAPFARSDNPNLPNPVTPSAANESAPQPQTAKQDPTNQPGIPSQAPVGATR